MVPAPRKPIPLTTPAGIRLTSADNPSKFARYRFNTENEMLVFAREAVESVDGFEDGSAYVLMTRQPEPEVITNDV